jgi:hypothetical protein
LEDRDWGGDLWLRKRYKVNFPVSRSNGMTREQKVEALDHAFQTRLKKPNVPDQLAEIEADDIVIAVLIIKK